MKSLLTNILILLSSALACAQTTTVIPEVVKTNFGRQNPTAQNIKWTGFKTDCMVTYSVNDVYNESYYKNNGELIFSACNLKEEALPKKTNMYLDSVRHNTTVDMIARVIDSKNDTAYQVKGETWEKKKRKIKYKAINLNFNSKGELTSAGRCFYTRFPYFYRKEKIKK